MEVYPKNDLVQRPPITLRGSQSGRTGERVTSWRTTTTCLGNSCGSHRPGRTLGRRVGDGRRFGDGRR